jgi:hypothetical protein
VCNCIFILNNVHLERSQSPFLTYKTIYIHLLIGRVSTNLPTYLFIYLSWELTFYAILNFNKIDIYLPTYLPTYLSTLRTYLGLMKPNKNLVALHPQTSFIMGFHWMEHWMLFVHLDDQTIQAYYF